MTFPAISTYPSGGGSSSCYGPDGNIWIANNSLGFVKMDRVGTVLATYAVSGDPPFHVCSDGTDLWASTAGSSGHLLRCTTAGVVTIFTPGFTSGVNAGLCYDPTSGCLFAGDQDALHGINYFRKVNLSGSLVASYVALGALGCVLGPDGNMWGTGQVTTGTWYLSRCTPSGVVTTFSPFPGSFTPATSPISYNVNQGMFSDGVNLWGCDPRSGEGIWKISTSGSAALISIALATVTTSTGALGTDGNLYVAGGSGGSPVFIQLNTSGSLLAHAPTYGPHSLSGSMVGDPVDGTIALFEAGTEMQVLTPGSPPAIRNKIVMVH